MVHVMCCPIDKWLQEARDFVVTIMDGNCPDVHANVHCKVCQFVHGKQEDVQVVRDTLQKAINWVKGMARKGCRNNPLVVGLVECLVEVAVVQPAMDPVDQKVGETDEQKAGDADAPPSWGRQKSWNRKILFHMSQTVVRGSVRQSVAIPWSKT